MPECPSDDGRMSRTCQDPGDECRQQKKGDADKRQVFLLQWHCVWADDASLTMWNTLPHHTLVDIRSSQPVSGQQHFTIFDGRHPANAICRAARPVTARRNEAPRTRRMLFARTKGPW